MESTITIGIDDAKLAEKLVQSIRESVKARKASGEFDTEAIARAERYNLSSVTDDAEFFDRYISCLRLVTQVDINDFEIVERRAHFAGFFKKLKRTIWSLLKFYTYHLWSQQNQVNSLFQAAIALSAKRDSELIAKMQKRIDELESKIKELEKKG